MLELSLLAFLILAHLLGDFYFQPKAWVTCRFEQHHRAAGLYYHAAVHGLLTILTLILFSKLSIWMCAVYALMVMISHWLIDLVKSYSPQSTCTFLFDQLAHLLVLILVWLTLTGQWSTLTQSFSVKHIEYKYIAVAIGYLLILKPTSIVISMLLKPWSEKIKQLDDAQEPTENTELQAAGERIGYLERLLILTFILLNQFSAIGFLLAAKSVFRFGDLTQDKHKKMTEYVMLGTLSSFCITILIGIFTAWIATQLPVGK